MSRYELPPALQGSVQEQLRALRSYLFRLSRSLSEAEGQVSTPAVSSNAASKTGNSAALKALILKTADTVEQEMDAVRQVMRSDYLARSDFGSFAETVETQYTATAAEISALYDYCALLQSGVDTLEQEQITSTGCIRMGIVEYQGTTPVLGIAIGQNITSSGTDTVDGREVEVLQTANLTTWTPTKMTFYQNGRAVAYLSNEKLYITGAEVTGELGLGGKWSIQSGAGLAVKWIGG